MVLLLTSTVVSIGIDVDSGDADFISTAIKLGAILLSWYTLVVYLILSIDKIINNSNTVDDE